ncbi:MAG: hypothetical protein D3925_06825 [Candidatus Electrothrix sp. AR5]|nr:hypothetical protein [Candidatus Electrothrix sp. AR5]
MHSTQCLNRVEMKGKGIQERRKRVGIYSFSGCDAKTFFAPKGARKKATLLWGGQWGKIGY